MGKKYRNLFDKITDIENLRLAYSKAVKGGNRYTQGHLKFKEYLEANLYQLQQEMISEKYELGEYYQFEVYEPKVRIIHSLPFRDRVVQHAINNIVEPIFEKTFYSTSYACRKNKGTHRGINKVQSELRKMDLKHDKFYFLKMDFSKYFQSIDSEILKKQISKKITDNKTKRILFLFINKNGVSIGNLLSQLYANIYGHIFDTFIKTKLKIKKYYRYMDDTVILHESKEFLETIRRKIEKFICIYMKLKFSKWFIQKANVRFLDFLGMRMKSRYKLIRKNSANGAKRKINKFLRLELYDSLVMFLASWLGHASKADSFNLLNLIRMEIENARRV